MTRSLKELSAEYLANVEVIEQRIFELQDQIKQTQSMNEKRILRGRIIRLRAMVNDARLTAFQMAHYYDSDEKRRKNAPKIRNKEQTDERTKFSKTGYGPPAPAAAVDGRESNRKRVSGLAAALFGRNPAN